jgi:hypothetical protein
MLSRRAFVQHGVTGSVTALVGGIVLAGRANARGTSPDVVDPAEAVGTSGPALAQPKLHLAIFDHRYAAGRRFAASSEAGGVATRQVTSDVTDLWYSELHPLWKRQPVAIAGLTTYAPLFCLERLAWDHGMRVLQREQHDKLHFWIIAPRSTPPALEPLPR